ncbi:hypothetical protein A2334_02935 [Candidatus Roizmanbacteria bacterium RIFOXYB2_FULL_38_10]|uniref:Glycosyl transferase family 1 domain-containing protein n=1 Tax=Candidatus Roizmanbacteria bacterium RIFOXYD1_FULL_38_12 TaxID=1802093 RepID=A0A1F7L0B0_9BACT|nr:MAG: hypothetical protein A3K47_02065 [Candidatus Roizmanbacteria bacterium RIFOXYA2_FULL_38_14]OGK63564.1 MAG: hypothetical protein A3K27_02065 [Candidatus Roizmanbacteria bacterium RIFOXYA1_FULL_37_12]OGK65410.1 MAG: hypothetical protein A3K38_02065 [Candidatus Roizmanbacteria bacterium RIFOXYB1_FULL_40_23]OGK69113.1 MAG: hypothetical protein A2334_02935 [Candidatus Roizmanbacteria bacterium RIFOXYB2_FULL_38_10]OGK69815.1 MAG: hypothetical protein A3K21_02070 [Candidatus Roizmanbacteria ba
MSFTEKKYFMIKIALVRGAYLNNFEGQSYQFVNPNKYKITGVSSMRSIHKTFPFEVIRLPSFNDWNVARRIGRAIANRTLGDIQNLFGLEKYACRFDIFHTADPHYYYSYQLAILRSQNKIKRLLVTSWETIPFNNESTREKKRNKHFVLKQTDHFLCYTDKAKECLIREGIAPSKITVIELGVNLQKFKPSDHTSQANSKSKHSRIIEILFVGRLVEEKGVMDLYAAYKNLKSQMSNVKYVKLHFIGEGPLVGRLNNMILNDGLKKYVIIERASYEKMAKVYRRANIFVLPSHRTNTWEEQYGMVLVEAMASGLPIIAYDTGAIKEVVGNAGIYIHEGDVGGLTFAIENLIKDTDFRIKVGTIGRERVKREFDCRKTAKKIEKLYEKLYLKF